MTDVDDDVMFWSRVRFVLEKALDGLPPEDRAARVAYCVMHNRHGVTAFDEGDAVRFEWGGRTLVVVDRQLFAEENYYRPVELTFAPLPPDDISELSEG